VNVAFYEACDAREVFCTGRISSPVKFCSAFNEVILLETKRELNMGQIPWLAMAGHDSDNQQFNHEPEAYCNIAASDHVQVSSVVCSKNPTQGMS